MADEQNIVKRIVWGEVFSFPHVFKSFKMAVHPSKLILGLAAIILILVGGGVMDRVWSIWGGAAWEGEIMEYFTTSPVAFEAKGKAWEDSKLRMAAGLLANAKNERHRLLAFEGTWAKLSGNRGQYALGAFRKIRDDYNKANEMGQESDPASATKILEEAKKDDLSWSSLVGDAEDQFEEGLDKIDDFLGDVKKPAKSLIEDAKLSKEERNKAKENLSLALGDAKQAITRRKQAFQKQVREIRGVGIFAGFRDYQKDCLADAIVAVRHLNFTGGLAEYQRNLRKRYPASAAMEINSGLPDPTDLAPKDDSRGLLFFMLMSAEGFRWLIMEHWFFAAIFLLWSLIVWSFLGGAIYRIAALHFAREEKISMFQALRFSQQKFLSFFSAPLVPIVVILGVGVLLMIGGFIGSIPFVGSLLMGILFGVAILMGIGVAFMLIGLIAGAPLMYPTIAVEGSDSFDAISRSFSYVFARPFRTILYGGVAAVYGAITYLFVRWFAYLALGSAHCFVKWGIWGGGSPMAQNADKLDVLWPRPTFWSLYQWNGAAMSGWDKISAILIGIWVLIVVGLLAAYVLTFFASASTSIYYILRRRVDATDLDDVYVEEEEELAPPSESAPEEAEEAEEAKEEDTPPEDSGEEKEEK